VDIGEVKREEVARLGRFKKHLHMTVGATTCRPGEGDGALNLFEWGIGSCQIITW